MKIALLQLNPTVGSPDANAEALRIAAHGAAESGATLAVAPELVVPGYFPRDLLERPAFVSAVEHATDRLIASLPPRLTLIFGTVRRRDASRGRPLLNEAVIAECGKVIARVPKQLLPNYDVFDETRYFEPGPASSVIVIDGVRVGVTVCEDAWAGSDWVESRYALDPVGDLSQQGMELLVNLSASPFTIPKLSERARMFSSAALRARVPVVLVNQVGANDELIFDGGSSAWDANGELRARAPLFRETTLFVEPGQTGAIAPLPVTNADAIYAALVSGVRDYVHKCGFTRAVLGLSGGIDSALTATIAADALGANNVIGVAMPSRYSSPGSVSDAAALAKNLGIEFRTVHIDPMFQAYLDHLGPELDAIEQPSRDDVSQENIQARIRGAIVMAISNRTGALVLTTGNKSELAVGYCTLYGDMVGGLAVISDVPKTMVYEIARVVNRQRERIPEASISKPPSAELRPDQTDQDSLPPYEILDPIIERFIERHQSPREIIEAGFDATTVDHVLALVHRSEHKRRQSAPGLIVTAKAFGPGRRIPVAQHYRGS